MYSRLRLSLAAAAVLLSVAHESLAQTTRTPFALQIASFPEATAARSCAARLSLAGLKPFLFSINLPGRGLWTRVLVGSFETTREARTYGATLIGRGLASEFLVVPTPVEAELSKSSSEAATNSGSAVVRKALPDAATPSRVSTSSSTSVLAAPRLPQAGDPRMLFTLSKVHQASGVPRSSPIQTARNFLVGSAKTREDAGLWLSGDLREGSERLRWIAGPDRSGLVEVGTDGRVSLDWIRLTQLAGVRDSARSDAALTLANYISADEGLLLLVQLTAGQFRYDLHVGQQAPTRGGLIKVRGGVNLDGNYDSRINPYRPKGKKLDSELPPEGFDSLVCLNPDAQWLNVGANALIPPGHITFHELAEAHAKLALGLDYLASGVDPGAHEVAVERERRLKSQRPGSVVVITAGANRVVTGGGDLRSASSVYAGGSAKRQ